MNSAKKPLIVAVDDEPAILNLVNSILKEHYAVRPFSSGQDALDFLENQTADLILLDYEMPAMTGCQLLEKLHADRHTRDIPVIFLTGSSDDGIEVIALQQGAADFILKPIRPEILLTRIHMQLELRGYRHHLETLVREKTEHLRRALEKMKVEEDITLSLLAKVTDLRDHDTGCHIKRTTEFVKIIIEDLKENPKEDYGLSEAECEDIVKSAKLHDIGKIATPDNILLKPGKLTPEEFDIIKEHPSHGAYLLDEYIEQMGDDSFLNTARDIALGHHEKWNGQGYPLGVSGMKIPLSARIVAIADVYDALTSARPYKSPLPHEMAMKIMIEGSGAHFDPYLVQIFLKHEKDFMAVPQS